MALEDRDGHFVLHRAGSFGSGFIGPLSDDAGIEFASPVRVNHLRVRVTHAGVFTLIPPLTWRISLAIVRRGEDPASFTNLCEGNPGQMFKPEGSAIFTEQVAIMSTTGAFNPVQNRHWRLERPFEMLPGDRLFFYSFGRASLYDPVTWELHLEAQTLMSAQPGRTKKRRS